jgi:beta-lactam-binding protein with PASTA domain
MTQRQVIEVMADVCAALDFSHRHSIIHRDVKPANIMINNAGAVKVMDFGIARALGEGQNVTQTAAVIGTAQYLSPEQARGEAVDARSDVYAAGCVLFELLTGEPPFTGDTPVAVAYQHVREEPRRPSELNPSIPSSLDAVVLKALSKNPANRYQSAAEMRSDLVRVRNGQSPMAPLVMSDDERTAMIAANPAATTRRINGRQASPPVDDYDDYYDEPPRRSTAKVIGVVLAVVLALAVVGFFAYQVFSGPPAPQTVAVPAVANMTDTDAKNQIIAAGLRLGDTQTQESSVDQKDRVINTNPPAGTVVDERSVVSLIVGGGPANVTVPRLEGMTIQQAEAALLQVGLELGAQTQQPTSDSSLVNHVIDSTPKAGITAKGGDTVAVIIGIQQTGVQIPNLAGQDLDDAEKLLSDRGLKPQKPDNADDNDKVSGTNPAAGETVPPNSEVELLTGSGDGEATMPNIVGKRLEQAQDQLAELGFQRIQTKRESVSNDAQDGRVLEQSIQPGEQVSTDQQITLTVGDAPGGLVN